MSRKRIAGAGGMGCFLGHTLVRVPEGQKRIDELQPGDLVLSFDDRGDLHQARVLKVHEHPGERVIRYRLWGGMALDATPNHWVLNQFNAFVEIGSLGSDDCLVDENGHLRPIVAKDDLGTGTVYNLTVEGHHTFIAGGIRVHNAGLGAGKIAGAGGGGGKGGGGGETYVPSEASDSLESTAYAKIIDLIGEGEIQGLKNGLQSIFINNTPLQNPDGSLNFKNVTVITREGTQFQQYIPGFEDVSDERSVNVNVTAPTPVVRTISDTAVDAIRVTVTVPALQAITDKGDIVGTEVRHQIALQYGAGGYGVVVDDTIAGRTGDAYQRDYLINLSSTVRPVNIRVQRITPDSTSSKLSNTINWTSYTEITYAKLRYANSALVALRVDAEQFNSIPSRSYLVRGLKIRIPSNATVDQTTGRLIYNGVWNGSFAAAQWCSDPAWCLYDLLTSKRYGFGDHVQAAQLDKWAFYAASQYASALVPNGFGGQEPRFSCNVNIQTQQEAFKLINELCSVFRVMPYWSTGSLTIAQDRPADSSYLFTHANVSEEGFSYSSSSQKTRPTVAVVSYMDLALRDTAYEVVENPAAIAKYGVVTAEVSAFATTSRGQARRIGEWLLYTEQYEKEVVAFTTSLEGGVIVRPGQIIDIADPVRAGARQGGRVSNATTSAITVDDASALISGPNAKLSVVLRDGTVETRAIGTITGNVITVTTPFSGVPNVGGIWVYQTDTLQTSQWRVLTIQEQDGDRYAINAISYNASKYDYIERNVPLQQRDVTNLNVQPTAPTNLVLTEALYSYRDQVRSKVLAQWKPVQGVNQYKVQWRVNGSNWQSVTVQGPDYEVLDTTPGPFDFRIYSVSAAGKLSPTALEGSITALGKTAPPANVTGFNSALDPSIGVTLTWDPIADIDLKWYEIRKGGTDWETATFVTEVAATSYKVGLLEAATTIYRIKAVDTSDVYSAAAASTTVTIGNPAAPTITSAIQGDLAVLNWSAVTGSYAIAYYEVRTSSGTLGRVNTTTFSAPITWTGSRTFFVKAVDIAGRESTEGSVVVNVASAPAPTVTSVFSGEQVVLSWNEVNGSTTTRSYEIRRGATLAGATVVTSTKSTSYSLKADWLGSQTFYVLAVDGNGNYGAAGTRIVTVAAAGAPVVATTFSGDSVVLSWAAVEGSLPTRAYEVREGGSFASAAVLATINATNYSVDVDWTGAATFWVAAIDSNGSLGAPGSAVATVVGAAAPSVTSQVSGNTLTLSWNKVDGTIPTRFYEIRRGGTYATATVLASIQSTSYSLAANWIGNQTFWITGIDRNGNAGTPGSTIVTISAAPAPVVSSVFSGEQAVLSWGAVKGTLETAYYEIRRGATFATATQIATINGTVYSLQVNWGGSQRFWVVAYDVNGSQGVAGSLDVVVVLPSQPTMSQQVVDNNVLLRWNDSTQSLPIVYYELRKGSTYAASELIGTKQGRFTSVFETVGGTYTYWLVGVDSAGNYGTPGSVAAIVNQPPDYVLRNNLDSTFSGTKTNIFVSAEGAFTNVDTTETWQQHFTSRGWTTLQDQVNAGFDFYGLPSTTTAAYEEIVDYGAVIVEGVKLQATLTSINAVGSTTITPKLSVRALATDPWIDYAGVEQAFVANFRYAKVRYDFSSSGNNDLLRLTALNIRLETKQKGDAGSGTANAADVGGTVVNFSQPFVDVQSITVTPTGTTPVIAIYDFIDAPNPTSFKVLLFNTSGVRVSGGFSWTARGV